MADEFPDLPSAEDDLHEFKSSAISDDKLKLELQVAASAYWNSGGGVLVAGVDGFGIPDGGIRGKVGKTARRDWIDQVLHAVIPTGRYTVSQTTEPGERGVIHAGHALFAVGFLESDGLPHMAPDNKYYVRAGAHSVPANHFQVETLRARRGVRTPMLRAALRRKRDRSLIVELVVLALTEAPALDVVLTPSRYTKALRHVESLFPLRIGVVERGLPFAMDYDLLPIDENKGEGAPVQLNLKYRDLIGREYEQSQTVEILREIGPVAIGRDPLIEIAQKLDDISRKLT